MTGREFDPVAPDQLDARIRELLDIEARQAPDAPSRDAMVERVARTLGVTSQNEAYRGRTTRAPMLRLVVVVGLLAALVAGIVAVGSQLMNTNSIVVAPSRSAPASLLPTADLCPGGTLVDDIRDSGTLAIGDPLWISGAALSVPPASTQIAVVATAAPASGGTPSTGIFLVGTGSDSSCLLVELAGERPVLDMLWSPSGDALVIRTVGESGDDGETLVWSTLGTRRLAAVDEVLAWAPDGSGFLVGYPIVDAGEAGIRFIPADGSEPMDFSCEPGRTTPCPAPPMIIWSPDSTRFVVSGGDRPAPSLFSIATMSDLQMRRIDAPMFGPDGPVVQGWSDASTLLVWHEGDYYRVPVDEPQATSLVGPAPTLGAFAYGDIAPDLAAVHFGDAHFEGYGDPLIVADIASGAETTVLRPADIDGGLGLYQVHWSPDGASFAVAMTASREPERENGSDPRPVVPGVWVVDRDGAALRKITSLQLTTNDGRQILAWRPSSTPLVQP